MDQYFNGVSFQIEVLNSKLIRELSPLITLHWEELKEFEIPLKPDFYGYIEAQKNGFIRFFTARSGGSLVGYSLFFVRHSSHHSTVKHAVQDLVFLKKEHRGRGTGRAFIQWGDEQLKSEGVEICYQVIKANKSTHGTMLESLGYKKVDVTYGRHL